MGHITYENIKQHSEINAYINKGNDVLGVLGYTDHGPGHTTKVAETAANILTKLDYDARTVELARIAGYIHDIGNMANRKDHAQTGALIVFSLLRELNMDPTELAEIVAAVGNHDEDCGIAISPISAALIIADKTDVRRSRVRNYDISTFDIHDRVNYAVTHSGLDIDAKSKIISLNLEIDNNICPVMDYFEIFLSRMLMCRKSADFLDITFSLVINNAKIM